MKKGSTHFLRATIVIMGLIALALCIFALPSLGRDIAAEFPTVPYLRYFILIGYAAAIPFFIALYHAFTLLQYIDKNTAFSALSVKALKNIKYCAIAIGALYALSMPFVFAVAQADDAPGLILIFGAIFIGAPTVVAVFAAVLQKLVQSAIDMKSENDLTI